MHLVKEQFYNFKNSLLMKNEKYNKTLTNKNTITKSLERFGETLIVKLC